MYQRKVDVDMLNAVKSALADVSSVSPSSEKRRRANARNVSQHVHSLQRSTYPHQPYVDTLYLLITCCANLFLAPASRVSTNILFLVVLMFLMSERPIQIIIIIIIIIVIERPDIFRDRNHSIN